MLVGLLVVTAQAAQHVSVLDFSPTHTWMFLGHSAPSPEARTFLSGAELPRADKAASVDLAVDTVDGITVFREPNFLNIENVEMQIRAVGVLVRLFKNGEGVVEMGKLHPEERNLIADYIGFRYPKDFGPLMRRPDGRFVLSKRMAVSLNNDGKIVNVGLPGSSSDHGYIYNSALSNNEREDFEKVRPSNRYRPKTYELVSQTFGRAIATKNVPALWSRHMAHYDALLAEQRSRAETALLQLSNIEGNTLSAFDAEQKYLSIAEKVLRSTYFRYGFKSSEEAEAYLAGAKFGSYHRVLTIGIGVNNASGQPFSMGSFDIGITR